MQNQRKTWPIVTVVIVVILVILIASNSNKPATNDKNFRVGAVLSLTGSASIWGETVKNGMELALKNYPDIKVSYEDSKSTPTDGVSAYNKVQNDGVDLTISELSFVAVPLSKLVVQNKKPLLVTLVAATSSSIVNDYTLRYYTDPNNYATPAFTSPISPLQNATKIAVLYRTDELGISVMNRIKELSAQYNKTIVSLESFKPNETDFSTVILKAKNSGAQAFLYVASTPGESLGIIKMATQLSIGMPIIEASGVLADLNTRAQVGSTTVYATSFDYTKPDHAVDFKTQYKATYGKEANFGAAFGYDMITLVSRCKDHKDNFLACIKASGSVDGIAGQADQVSPGNFVVGTHLEKVN